MDRVVDSSPSAGTDDATRELQDFSYIVSHDLAAEIRHLCEFTKLIVGELDPAAQARSQRYIDILLATEHKTRAMLDALLRFSRIQQAPLAMTLCDGTGLIDRATARFKAAGAVSFISDVSGSVIGDATLLSEAIQNILDNAVRFQKPGITPVVEIKAFGGGEWTLFIRDNGVGLDERYQDKAFQMFWRLDPSLSNGVGAGLAIARRIIRRHHGDVRFVPCDTGACVKITLPAQQAIPQGDRQS